MLKIFVLAILIIINLVGPSSFANNEGNSYLRKIRGQDGSVMFLSCQKQSCRVLGGGSFSQSEVRHLVSELKMIHYTKSAAIVTVISANVILNPMLMMAFLTVPAGVITMAATGTGVALTHKTFDSYKEFAVLQNQENEVVNQDLLKTIEENFDRLRSYLNLLRLNETSNYQLIDALSIPSVENSAN